MGCRVAAFTGCYAVFGPLVAGRAGRCSRRSLIIALGLFTIANVATFLASGVGMFLVARSVAGRPPARTHRCRPLRLQRWCRPSGEVGLFRWSSLVWRSARCSVCRWGWSLQRHGGGGLRLRWSSLLVLHPWRESYCGVGSRLTCLPPAPDSDFNRSFVGTISRLLSSPYLPGSRPWACTPT